MCFRCRNVKSPIFWFTLMNEWVANLKHRTERRKWLVYYHPTSFKDVGSVRLDASFWRWHVLLTPSQTLHHSGTPCGSGSAKSPRSVSAKDSWVRCRASPHNQFWEVTDKLQVKARPIVNANKLQNAASRQKGIFGATVSTSVMCDRGGSDGFVRDVLNE